MRLLQTHWVGFLSLVYPKECVACGEELHTQSKFLCIKCWDNLDYTFLENYKEPSFADELFWGRVPIKYVFSLLYFEQGNISQKIVHHIKYKEGKDLGVFIGQLIGERMKCIEKFNTIDALVPIPLHPKKAFIRGYNQSELIVKGIHKVMEIPVVDALFRKTHDSSQTHKSKEERYQNVKEKFAAFPHCFTTQKHVAIVDDVLTTGATLEFASKALLYQYPNLSVSIITIAIAH